MSLGRRAAPTGSYACGGRRDHFLVGQEEFPAHATGIRCPVLIELGVAALRVCLAGSLEAHLLQALARSLQCRLVAEEDPEVLEASGAALADLAGVERENQAKLCWPEANVVRPHQHGVASEEGSVEGPRAVQVRGVDGHMVLLGSDRGRCHGVIPFWRASPPPLQTGQDRDGRIRTVRIDRQGSLMDMAEYAY